MYKRSSEDLGLIQVLESVASYALSDDGQEEILASKPVTEEELWSSVQKKVEAALYCRSVSASRQIYCQSFPSIHDVFESLESNPTANLEGEQIFRVGCYIRSTRALSVFLNLAAEDESPVSSAGVQDIIVNVLDLDEEIFQILESPGIVKESHPAIRALHEEVDKRRYERSKLTASMMREQSTFMQGEKAVLRDNRIVLPVKVESKNQIPGFIHSASQSGGTVFMEPFKLIEMNNAVVMAEQQIQIEIAKLLARLTDNIRAVEVQLRLLTRQIAKADWLYAFATWVQKNNCSKVLLSQDFSCNLIKARHPLLKKKAVPIDLSVNSGIKAVVLTGPNAGGKTVTMKTVGLFALLNQVCGYVPADDGTALSLFDQVFTDIGDDQSIENALSTFSGHMKGIGFILRNLTSKSLVILDELGSGTDPQEGAALARSILEYCIQKACLTLITSHHGVLKQFAYSQENILNASMEFNESSMEPTFKVISGLPGESHAIDTARRMRLPKIVTQTAETYLGQEAVKISSIIRALEQKRREADLAEADINQRLGNLKAAEEKNEQFAQELKKLELRLKKGQLGDFQSYMNSSRKALENLVAELRTGEITREKTKKVKEFIVEQEKKGEEIKTEIAASEDEISEHEVYSGKIEPGMDVLCGVNKREGTVVRSAGKGKWVVAIGQIKFTFKESDLSLPRRKNDNKFSYSVVVHSTAPRPKVSMDLRGYTVQEAIEALQAQLESCLVHGISNFSIIHGYGDGHLSKGIHAFLKEQREVQDYYFAHPEDGGQGKTYVELG